MDIIQLHTQWQTQWRTILGESTEDMPDDVCCDYVLHFDIWALDDDKLQECFSLFPSGLAMLERAQAVRSIVQKKIAVDDAVLLGHLEKLNTQVESVLAKSQVDRAINRNNKKSLSTKRTVYRGDNDLRRELFNATCGVTQPLDDIVQTLFESQLSDVGPAAYDFLREPFYRITDDAVIRGSIFWAALQDEYGEDPFESVIELYKVTAQAAWNEAEGEMFVFIEQ